MNEAEASQLAARTGGTPFAIDVYCDDGSHSPEEQDVLTFAINPVDQPPIWTIYAASKKWRHGHGQQLTKAHADARVALRGNRPLTDEEITADTYADPEVRVRYRLSCNRCDRPYRFLGDKLHPVLDRMALGGVPRISLARLAATVTN